MEVCHPPSLNDVIIFCTKEIMFWVCYPPTLWQIVINFAGFFLKASLMKSSAVILLYWIEHDLEECPILFVSIYEIIIIIQIFIFKKEPLQQWKTIFTNTYLYILKRILQFNIIVNVVCRLDFKFLNVFCLLQNLE